MSRWATVSSNVVAWWDENRAADRASVLFCYTLGKAQRLLAELSRVTDRRVLVHGAMTPVTLTTPEGLATFGSAVRSAKLRGTQPRCTTTASGRPSNWNGVTT